MPSVVVGRDAILRLEAEEYSRLIQEGTCAWNYYPLVEEHTERKLRVPSIADACLALDKSRSHFWFEFEPEADLDRLLDHSCVTSFDFAAGRVLRGQESSLRAELAIRTGIRAAMGTRPFLPVAGAQDPYGNYFQESAVASFKATGRLLGQLAVCGCGEPGCGATYAWFEQGTGLLVVEISAAGMNTVELGPFALVGPDRHSE